MTKKQISIYIDEEKLKGLSQEAKRLDLPLNCLIRLRIFKNDSFSSENSLKNKPILPEVN
jgi:hypothetical protein